MSLFNVQSSGRELERRDAFGIHNPFENPTVPLTAVGLDNVYGMLERSDSGESVTYETALTIPTFWRCVGLLSTIIAGCPLRAYKVKGKEEVFPDILSQANGDMRYTQFELWELVVTHILCWGNAYILKYREPGQPYGRNVITDLRPIHPERVSPKVDKEGNKIFEITRINSQGQIDNTLPKIILTTFEVMHIPGLGYDGLMGLSPVTQFIRTLGTGIAADKLAARFFSKGTQLSGIISVRAPLKDQNQADQIRNRWIARSGGVAHGAEVAVLDAETSFQPLTIPPDSLQFLESRRWETTEIARMFGIPPHLVGDVEKTTSWGTGIEQQNIAFASYTVAGYTNRIEQRVSREVVTKTTEFCEFDLNRLMRGSMNERFQAYALAIQSGWVSRNEVRALENMEPKAHLNEYLMPLNMMPAGQEPATGQNMPGNNTDEGPNAGDSVANGTNTGNSSSRH